MRQAVVTGWALVTWRMSRLANVAIYVCSTTISRFHVSVYAAINIRVHFISTVKEMHHTGRVNLQLELGARNVDRTGVGVDKLQRVVRAHDDRDELSVSGAVRVECRGQSKRWKW